MTTIDSPPADGQASWPSGRFASSLTILLLAGAGTFAGARLGYAFAIQPAHIVVVWPPAGFVLAVLLLTPARSWPLVLVGACLGNVGADLQERATLLAALAGSLVNAAESLTAAWVIRRVTSGPITLSTLRQLGTFVVGGAVISNAVTAVLGALFLNIMGRQAFTHAWFIWWAGDGLGMLLVAPALILWATGKRERATAWQRVEGLGLAVALIAAALWLLWWPGAFGGLDPTPDTYMLTPLLFWIAMRKGPRGAALATLGICAATLWPAAQGGGPFIGGPRSPTESVLEIYVFLAITALCGLIPAVMLHERHEAERRLARSQARSRVLADALESTNEAVGITDVQGRFTFVNRAFLAHYGYESREVLGQTSALLMPPGASWETFRDIRAQAIERGWSGELLHRRKDGTTFLTSLNLSAIRDSAGQTTGVLGVGIDVTEERRTEQALRDIEERMRFALQASHVGIWEVDFRTGVVYWSDICEAIHGLPRGGFGRSEAAFLACVHAEDRQYVGDVIARASRERSDLDLDYRTAWPDGSVHWVHSIGRFSYDDTGTPVRGAGVVVDISDRRSLEEQLRQSQKMEAIGLLAGGVAHDFNNLLTAIIGYAGQLSETIPENDDRREDLSEISRAGERAARLTQQLLAFSRRQIVAPRVLKAGVVIRDIAPMLRRLLGETIDLRIQVRDAGAVRIDPGQLEQILVNLVVNAHDAMRTGGWLTVETSDVWLAQEYTQSHVGVEAGPYVLLAVTDTGHGMDDATRARVFEPFFTTKANGQGTGLGLAVVHGIVRQAGGHVAAYSEVGRGSTFKVYLPRVDVPSDVVAPAAAPASVEGSESIALVEDDPAVRDFIRRTLTRRGYDVHGFADPRLALDFIVEHRGPVHAVITDVVLPGINGPALAQQVQAVRPATKILLMSGYADGAITHQDLLTNGAVFMQKPFAGSTLLRTLRELLDTPS